MKLLQNLEQLLLKQLSHTRKNKQNDHKQLHPKKCKIDQRDKIQKENLMVQFWKNLELLSHTTCGK